MKVRIRFFARFRELLGTDIVAEPAAGTVLVSLIRDVARKNREGYKAIFDDQGNIRGFVIMMRNGKRIEAIEAENTGIADGDEIAIFPPVSGG